MVVNTSQERLSGFRGAVLRGFMFLQKLEIFFRIRRAQLICRNDRMKKSANETCVIGGRERQFAEIQHLKKVDKSIAFPTTPMD